MNVYILSLIYYYVTGFETGERSPGGALSFLLLRLELLLEAVWHAGWGWPGEPEGDLDTVVDEPLQGGEGTDHDDPGSKAGPHAIEAESLGCTAHCRALRLVHVRHNRIGGVGYDGTEHCNK